MHGALFNKSASVNRRTRATDSQGGHTKTYALSSTENMRIKPASAAERLIGEQSQALFSHVGYARPGADIARGDQLVINSITYDVIAVKDPSLSGHHQEFQLQEVHKGN